MLIDKNGKLVRTLDFRGTKIALLDKLSSEEMFRIIAATQQAVNMKESFKALDLVPKDWEKSVYAPIFGVAKKNKMESNKLLGVVIKQALIMTPLLFTQVGSEDFSASTYVRESLNC
jgi:hypothetical protein